MADFNLIIFDCDGVLVDSEPLAAAVARDMLAELGLQLTIEEIGERFNGRKVAQWVGELEAVLNRPLAESFIPEFRRRSAEKFRAELKPVAGIRELLDRLPLPYCLASSGPLSKIHLTLSLTGLLGYFEGRIFSGYEVGSWKPDPELFLHAARAFAVAPRNCAVIEDSRAGVEAGLAAGMRVFHYRPQPAGPAAAATGVVTFSAMEQLPALLGPG